MPDECRNGDEVIINKARQGKADKLTKAQGCRAAPDDGARQLAAGAAARKRYGKRRLILCMYKAAGQGWLAAYIDCKEWQGYDKETDC